MRESLARCHPGPLAALAGSADVFYAPFLMSVLPVVPLIGEQKGNRREPGGQARTGGCPALRQSPVPGLSRAIGGHWELGPQTVWICPSLSCLDDSTSPRSWLGSEGPRQVGEGEPLPLSQQLLLPLPVLLKFWLWTQAGGGSCQPLLRPPPTAALPPAKVTSSPSSS